MPRAGKPGAINKTMKKLPKFSEWLAEAEDLSREEQIELMRLGLMEPIAWFDVTLTEPNADWAEVALNRMGTVEPKHRLLGSAGLIHFDQSLVPDLKPEINRWIRSVIDGGMSAQEYLDRVLEILPDLLRAVVQKKYMTYTDFALGAIRWYRVTDTSDWYELNESTEATSAEKLKMIELGIANRLGVVEWGLKPRREVHGRSDSFGKLTYFPNWPSEDSHYQWVIYPTSFGEDLVDEIRLMISDWTWQVAPGVDDRIREWVWENFDRLVEKYIANFHRVDLTYCKDTDEWRGPNGEPIN